MADNTVKVRLQSAYKTSADWDTLNPVLKNGEVGYVSSPASMYGWYKIGNGTSTWKQLPYSTYRPLNNGDFDTINVTDETAGDLIVTGAARFLNTIQGTASSASNAAKTTGTLTIKAEAGAMTTPSTTFNGSSNVTATIKVPSHTSHLTNNSGFITSGATVAAANKTTGTLTLQVAGTTKATFNGNTTTYNVTTSDLGIGTAGLKASGAFLSSATKYAGSTSVGGVANDSAKLGGQSSTYYASTSYVNERVANAVHFKGGFDPSNADALKTPVKEIGDMYVATAAGTFYSLALESGDSIIFQSSVAANTNPTSANFIGVEKTVSVTNSGPTLAWNTVSTVGTVEGVALTVKSMAKPTSSDLGLGTMAFKSSADYSGTGHKHDDLYFPATNVDNSLKIESKVLKHKTTVTAAANISGTANVSGWGATATVVVPSIDAYGHTTACTTKTITMPSSTGLSTTDEKLKMTPASATKFYPAGGTSQTSAVSTAYFSSAVYIQGTSVVAANFVGTATTASYAANAAKVNNLTVQTAVPSGAVFTDTKNTAGSTNSDSKLFLIGATSQAANPQTYSDSEVYTTNGTLTTNKVQVGGTAVTLQFNSTTKSLDFVFA